MKDPVVRTASPYINPSVENPKTKHLFKAEISDLRKSTLLSSHPRTTPNPSIIFHTLLLLRPVNGQPTYTQYFSDEPSCQQDLAAPRWCPASPSSLRARGGASHYCPHRLRQSIHHRQPFRRRSLRRCPRLRDWYRHHLQRCSDCLLRHQDRPLSSRQANCPGARVRKGRLVCVEPCPHAR